MKRQNVRRGILLTVFLLFPITIWYFSPYLIIAGAIQHSITGSFIVFLLMLVISPFLGRVFCAYLCPAGGVQECAFPVNGKNPRQGRRNYIKYVIWGCWITAVVVCFILGKNSITIHPFFMTDHGISVSNIYAYVVYYGVLFLIIVPAFISGKRTFCHYFCWMAPFMVLGSLFGRLLHLNQIHIAVDKKEACTGCRLCNKNCPMGLDVAALIPSGAILHTECIQCGSCVDNCPQKVLSYSFGLI
jgi:polyferredoxin